MRMKGIDSRGSTWWKSVVLSFILGGLILYGITSRAIIEYELGVPLRISETINFEQNRYLQVALKFRNSGHTDALLILRVTVENAVILNDTIRPPHKLISESEAEFYYSASHDMKNYAEITIHVIPVNDAEYFVIKYKVEKRLDLTSPSYMLSYIFGEIRGYYPTSLAFEKVDSTTYRRIS